MTANIAKFFRHSPAGSLEKYFKDYPSQASEAVDWENPPASVSKPLIVAVDDLNEDDLAILNSNAERINEMTDEIGQDALLAVIPPEDRADFAKLANGHDRALYVFLRKPKIWYLGQAWLSSRKTNIVFARRLNDDDTASALNSFLDDRHKRDPAMVITSSISVPSYLKLPHQNRLLTLGAAVDLQEEHLCFKVDYMTEKMGGTISQPGFSAGYRTLHSNGVEYSFSKKKASVLEFMDKAAKPMHQSEIMANSDSSQDRLVQLFRGDPAWTTIFKTDGCGVYWLDY